MQRGTCCTFARADRVKCARQLQVHGIPCVIHLKDSESHRPKIHTQRTCTTSLDFTLEGFGRDRPKTTFHRTRQKWSLKSRRVTT